MRTSVVVLIGSGVGAEVAAPAIELIRAAAYATDCDVDIRDISAYAMDFERIERIYRDVADAGGVILRTSIHASVCYRLRETFELSIKAIPISPLGGTDLWKGANNLDVLLVRENCCGLYHAWNYLETGDAVCAAVRWKLHHLEHLAMYAFQAAAQRRRRVHLLLKTDVLGKLAERWVDSFVRVARSYPHVQLKVLSPDTGASLMLLNPEEFDVVATADHDGDLLSDILGALTYGTRGVAASVNRATSGFATYQTLHGTGDKLKGKDCANPIGMLVAAALLLDDVAPTADFGRVIRTAIGHVLDEGYRTKDMVGGGQMIIGTHDLGNMIVEAVISQMHPAGQWAAAH